jgi:hypothetical protein
MEKIERLRAVHVQTDDGWCASDGFGWPCEFIGSEMVYGHQRVAERRICEAQGIAVPKGDQAALNFGTEETA